MAELIPVAKKSAIAPGKGMAVDVKGTRVAVFNINGEIFAIDDTCTHAGGSLSEGDVEGNIVTCPWHGATFDVTSGNVLSEPAADSVKSYKVRVEGDDIKIEI